MMNIHTLKGIYCGRINPDYANGRSSAIDKQPITGRVHLDHEGLVDDEQADRNKHGGPERALLHYSLDHYPWWQARYPGHTAGFRPSGFGENLASAGLDEHSVHIGDIVRIGQCRLQVSQPRSPCWKLDVRFGIPGMARQVQETARCGWFYRVLEPGTLTVGDPIERLERLPGMPSVAAAMRIIHQQGTTAELQALADCDPLSPVWREKAQRKLI